MLWEGNQELRSAYESRYLWIGFLVKIVGENSINKKMAIYTSVAFTLQDYGRLAMFCYAMLTAVK